MKLMLLLVAQIRFHALSFLEMKKRESSFLLISWRVDDHDTQTSLEECTVKWLQHVCFQLYVL